MILWRPIFEGLLRGISFRAQSNSGGVGCLLQRASIMTLRAILLRHGHQFSVSQWDAILREIICAIQCGVESDNSPVTMIVSESPAVSNLDFLSDPLPLPPEPDDVGLNRSMGVRREKR